TDREKILAQPAFYTLLGLFVGFINMRYNVPHVWLTSVLALTTLVLTASYYLIRNREISLIGQVYLGFAVLSWMLNVMDKVAVNPWWNPAMIIACLLALGHWWQHQKAIQGMNNAGKILQGIYALGMMGVVFLWLEPHFTPQHWLAFTSLLAVGITGYGIITRAWFLASCGQLFMWISVWEFVRQMSSSEPTWLTALTPIMTLIGTAMAVSAWLEVAGKSTREINKAVNSVGTLYRVAAILMALWWVLNYIRAREQIWVFCAAGGVIFALAGWRKSQEALLFSMVFFASGWISLILVLLNNPQNALYWPNLLCIFLLAGLQRVARHWPNHYSVPRGVHPATMLTCGLTLWLYLSQWVTVVAQGHSYITASWAGLALLIFATGFILRERTYRWLGLIILAADLGRVVMFDVWKLETLYRILSFMALGIALLVLGFVYNKFQEKIKEWM
ncbi:MAG: Membrane protein-like protein, partial [Verrucomicrobiales bacterium]|nr:Membrane protein-like protein [Verrucomicrobiales bacterium]